MPVQDLITMLFDVDMMEKTMAEFEVLFLFSKFSKMQALKTKQNQLTLHSRKNDYM